jgi:hypothetical protein
MVDKPRYARAQRLGQYGLTEVEFDELWTRQQGRCEICGWQDETSDRTGLNVDHCHAWGHVRALLCRCCNTGLAMFRDDPTLLTAAISYLREHNWPLLGMTEQWKALSGKTLSQAEFLQMKCNQQVIDAHNNSSG